jgi:hypothetical protein
MKEKQVSTATYERPLYSVPGVPPSTKSRFAALLALREAARRAFDKAMSLPRSAFRWAVNLFDRWVDATASAGVLAWLGRLARSAVGLLRKAGVVPVAVAVLSTPPVATAVTRLARFVGNGVLRAASFTWAVVRDLLTRSGTTGTQIAEGLEVLGAMVADSIRAAARHPLMAIVLHALRATLDQVRLVSQSIAVTRLLGVMIPIVWLRAVIGLLIMPFVFDPTLAGQIRDLIKTPPTTPDPTGNGTNNQEGLLIDAFGPEVSPDAPTPSNGNSPGDDATTEDDQRLNRAARRAQQREDAQAKRTQHPHR